MHHAPGLLFAVSLDGIDCVKKQQQHTKNKKPSRSSEESTLLPKRQGLPALSLGLFFCHVVV
jgi:hypothetical protein